MRVTNYLAIIAMLKRLDCVDYVVIWYNEFWCFGSLTLFLDGPPL